MNCNEFSKFLSAYVDHELGVDRAVELEEHLEGCQACARRLQVEQWIAESVRRHYVLDDCPPALEQKVRALLVEREASWRWIVPSAAVTALLAAVVVAWLALHGGGSNALVSPRVALADRVYEAVRSGEMPLLTRSADAAVLDRWLAERLVFYHPGTLRLPDGMVPEGANVLRAEGEDVGVVVYRSGNGPAVLVVAAKRDLPAQGARVRLGRSEFRTFAHNGRKFIAWNHGEVSYVLVSEGEQDGARACASCHAGVASDGLKDFGRSVGREL
ncbi:MAG: zf-HC2 domain-containing protein [Candidatus Binatia bacterium]|nr:zf-HC2 domain-containing protein [Candidatus Binatia bacterium]